MLHQSGVSDDFNFFSKYSSDFWCMDLAFVDKLASQNNGVKKLLVAVNICLRFARVQTRKIKYAKDTLQVFKKIISQKTILKNFGLIKEQNMGELLKVLQGERH